VGGGESSSSVSHTAFSRLLPPSSPGALKSKDIYFFKSPSIPLSPYSVQRKTPISGWTFFFVQEAGYAMMFEPVLRWVCGFWRRVLDKKRWSRRFNYRQTNFKNTPRMGWL